MQDADRKVVRIERASPSDARTLARLSRRVHGLHVAHAPGFFLQPTESEMEAAFVERLGEPRATALVAYDGTVPIGYVLALVQERPASALVPARRWLYVDQISVEPQWARRGVGCQLMKRVVDLAREAGLGEVVADVWAFNTEAQAFFKARGFQPQMERLWMSVDQRR
jgi:diamine N-acetyltransferase